jgi:uncharacterized protein YcbX
MADVVIGPVTGLWRYPVKSMRGKDLDSVSVSERGFLGDRAYALIDKETGKIGSAKNPRKWPKLLDFGASFTEPPSPGRAMPSVRIDFPDGSSVSSDAGDVHERLSRAFSRPVIFGSAAPEAPSLEEYWPDIDGLAHRETVTDEAIGLGAPAGSFFDFSAIHLVTTATLRTLSRAYANGRFDPRRFRPNVIVESSAEGFPENDWIGRRIAMGEELLLEVLIPCPRCIMTTLAQSGLPLDSGILRTAAQLNTVMIAPLGQAMPSVGVYAKVLASGTVRRGDSLRLVG